MADQFCLMPEAIEDFKKALKDKSLDMAAFFDTRTTTAEREAMMRPYAGDNALGVVRKLEQTRVLKNRELGLENAIGKIAKVGKSSPERAAAIAQAKADFKAQQAERIFSPQEHETFLNSLADKIVGTHISKEVAQKVFELSAKAEALRDVNPKMSGVSDEYLQARNQLNAYVARQKNAGPLQSIGRNLITIGRNDMLLGLSTPVKTTISQAVNSVMDAISRRISNLSLGGAASDVARQANAEAWQTYRKTGVNTASMENLGDIGLNKLGERLSFRDVSTSNAGGAIGAADRAIGKYAALTQKIAIDWEHNISFTKFYQKTFFDAANLLATKAAKLAGGEANGIMADAARIEPLTEAGQAVRAGAQEQAARVTSTNQTWLSNISMGVKNALNRAVPNFALGDLLIPMAKIPSTVIANAIDNAGAGIPRGIIDIVKGREAMQSTDMATKLQGMVQQGAGIQRLTRIFGVMGTAAYISSQLGAKDFRTDKWGNHFVHVAGLWVNMEYFAAVSPALAGMMWMRQKATRGEGAVNEAGHFVAGAAQGLKSAPGADELMGLITAITQSSYEKGIYKYFKDAIKSRAVPAFIPKITGKNPLEHLFFGAHGVESDAEVRQDEIDRARKAALSRAGVSQ